MRRMLFEQVKVVPGGVGVVVDRTGFLSAILGVNVTAGTDSNLKVTVQHSDTEDGEFVAVDDSHIGVEGALKEIKVSAGDMVNMDIDLIGCKPYIKIEVVTEATATYALVLGDCSRNPV